MQKPKSPGVTLNFRGGFHGPDRDYWPGTLALHLSFHLGAFRQGQHHKIIVKGQKLHGGVNFNNLCCFFGSSRCHLCTLACRSLLLDTRVYVEIKILYVRALMSATWAGRRGPPIQRGIDEALGKYISCPLSLNLPNPSQTDLRLKQLLWLHILSRVRQSE